MLMMKHSLITGLLYVALFIQAPSTAPLRLGGGAQQLSESDIASIESLLPGNTKPWLYGDIAPEAQTSAAVMGVFLPATTQTSELRRGKLVTLRWPDNAPDSRGWTIIDANGSYAQVAAAGRSFDQVQGNRAANRPFQVLGTITDADLLKIVSVARARSSFGLPLLSIERNAQNQILVSNGFERLVLEIQSQEWVLIARESLLPASNAIAEPRLPASVTPPQVILRHVESRPQ
jgi:hypothetical protein